MIQLYPGMQDNAFGTMMVELIRQNLAEQPDKVRAFERLSGRVALIADDIDSAVTLRFTAEGLTVFSGVRGIPDVSITGSSQSMLDLSRIPPGRPLGVDLRSEPARAVGKALWNRSLRIRGVGRHPRLLAGIGRLLSVY